MKKILQDLSLEELEAELTAQGEKKFRAAQIYGGMLSGKTIEELPAVPNPRFRRKSVLFFRWHRKISLPPVGRKHYRRRFNEV